jgi:Bacterial Ig domain
MLRRIISSVVRNLPTALIAVFIGHLYAAVPNEVDPFSPCPSTASAIACENSKPGSPRTEWDSFVDQSLQGFATRQSLKRGEVVNFKIKTDVDVASYDVVIYRLGYYAGMGARKITTIAAVPSQRQPQCLTIQSPSADPTIDAKNFPAFHDCGNWMISARWVVPSNATSGVYVAKLIRSDDRNQTNHIYFVVRDVAGSSDLLFQTSDTTWQAYNPYPLDEKKRIPGYSLYRLESTIKNLPRGYKVSFNRPYLSRTWDPVGRRFMNQSSAYGDLFQLEYPMIRFLERNGYNVSYISGADTDIRGAYIRRHKVFVSVGHDEYWSGPQRSNVSAARAAGVHLAFFSANAIYWKTRWETDPYREPHRILVSFKDGADVSDRKIDPQARTTTGPWGSPAFGPPLAPMLDGYRPENGLSGQITGLGALCLADITVPESFASLRFWRNSTLAQARGTTTLSCQVPDSPIPCGAIGYEIDTAPDDRHRPVGLFPLSRTIIDKTTVRTGCDAVVPPHTMTLYKTRNGALVFAAGTMQLALLLDEDPVDAFIPHRTNRSMQQAMVNLFADMNSQPATPQADLVPAAPSQDSTPPAVTIISPGNNTRFHVADSITVTGSASDIGGKVAGVEVSVNGGHTWHIADGSREWQYTFKPTTPRVWITILARGVDDSGNSNRLAPAKLVIKIL